MRALRAPVTAIGITIWLMAGLAGGLVFAAGIPVLAGLRSFTVMSGSMRPTLGVGDVVVTKPVAAQDVRPGDVITFKDPEHHNRMLTHRVTLVHLSGDRVLLATKGDANNRAERWMTPAGGRVGRVVYHLPLIGYGLVWTHGRYARLLLVVVPAVLLGFIELARIWRPRRPEDEPAGEATARIPVADVSA
jgi:signal peptidase I